MRSILVLALLVPTVAYADDVHVAAAPDIAAAPERDIDPDLAARLTDAEALVDHAQLDHALDEVLVLERTTDPFTVAQRQRIAPRATAILSRIGERARRHGDVKLAARAYDARWLIGGDHDRDAAAVLLAWSEREPDDARALYLARRAHAADPDLVAAARRDQELSTNRRAWPGRLLIVAAAATFGAGLYAQATGHDTLATGLYVATPIMSTGGVLLMLSGVRSYSPSSPAELPSLQR
jgi:hypothetical protein